MKLIDKDALIAEIDNLIDKGKHHDNYQVAFRDGNNSALYALKGRVNTLEVKEVNLEKDVRQIIDLYFEAGKYYDDVIKKERNMYGYSDLAIKLLDRTADAEEMSIQYILDKLRAQKGE